MSAEIISFPLKSPTGLDQQRWIPAPRGRRTPALSLVGWLRLTAVLLCIVSSWLMVIGTAHLIAFVL
jgi:hypothetical protein